MRYWMLAQVSSARNHDLPYPGDFRGAQRVIRAATTLLERYRF